MPSTSHASLTDVLIIGGGPAGSTAGSWLGRQGIDTLICEKERFPRFHIGESLLPNGNGVLREIGVWDKVQAAGFVKKYGAEFTLPDRSQTVNNVFSHGIVKGREQTFQVERARFDKLLLDHAADSGCQVQQRVAVTQATRQGERWDVIVEDRDTGESRNVSARWIIDASGRACVMGRTLGIGKETIPYPGRFAVFNHFNGVPRAAGHEGGNIIIIRLKDAWFWVIPLSDSTTSVGVVAQKGARTDTRESNESFFWRKVAESKFLSDSLAQARPSGDYRVESDYCFSYDSYGQDNVLLAGDAASFIDPVFSSGVYLALESGLLSAKTIERQIRKNKAVVSSRVYLCYTSAMKRRIRTMRLLIESFYDNKSFEVFMFPAPRLRIPAAINSILAGCTRPPFAVRWRFWLFRQICALHKKRAMVPFLNWTRVTRNPKLQPEYKPETTNGLAR
ncbi:NAD(P)/FAD-dependent oxidoreductase [Pelagicoccus sp. SDUM812002]|uniref:NAD(P)/FAD-dependent oxidoreductase n=1 Tax=Pelagicoccus sp. SDUM812002 TaxID=3041266 RepID=UPI00280CFE63|nr:NAD(P)/FAD-dependent oxidoreductase [Pelagicoccus sp. SDUM812002]MDQ8186354.1 NAD(P)/FAD-dependent oxidoreductase [Pelagicoccus sp. SDUM812002]